MRETYGCWKVSCPPFIDRDGRKEPQGGPRNRALTAPERSLKETSEGPQGKPESAQYRSKTTQDWPRKLWCMS